MSKYITIKKKSMQYTLLTSHLPRYSIFCFLFTPLSKRLFHSFSLNSSNLGLGLLLLHGSLDPPSCILQSLAGALLPLEEEPLDLGW